MKKLNLHLVEEKLLDLDIKIFQPHILENTFNVSGRAVSGVLNYNTKKGVFARLKPGFYALKRNMPPDFYLANYLYSPSYISLETALSYYNLIPETVYSVTSVTSKPTREFDIQNRAFSYSKIKKGAYTGYIPTQIEGKMVYIATPEKAAADFLYFVSLGKRSFNDRLNVSKLDKTKLRDYLKLFRLRKEIRI